MRLALIYNKENDSTLGAYIERVLKESSINCTHFWTSAAEQIPFGYDLYFRIDHGDYKYDISDKLRPAIFYAVDTHLKKPYRRIKQQVKHYDIIFCAQKEGQEKLKRELKIDVQWVPLGCDPQIHKKIAIVKKYDVGFVGSEARKFPRGKLIDLIRKNYPCSYLGGADFRKMSEIYSSSKIGFNYSISNDINMRIFEIMSCGTLLLTNYIKNNGFEELFENKKNVLIYRNSNELLDLIDYYLKNDSERENIAKEGYKLATDKYTYFKRLQAIFNYTAFKFGGKFNSLRI
ncbi:MAG: glycosyltransferase family 1 protein [Candidatus Omnitrophica bacterium]|jgi:glycosyltransferase involved in cell wall biosynthesis|nr:glycosyltransferase family 1 protein [Candidatus Omnitrophota bacterium]